jgi:thiol-disulfide isomerase/thioredoxin
MGECPRWGFVVQLTPAELARYRYRIPIRSVCADAAQHFRVAQIVDGHNSLPNAIEDVRFAATATRSKAMAQGLSNCIRAVGAMLVAVPIAFAGEPPRNVIMHETPERGAVVRFEDDQGQPRSLADFRGKVVLLNVWATWCAPCIKEIPALDHLAAALNGADFAVVAVSVDRKGTDAVRKVFADLGVQKLPIYLDRSGQALRTVRAIGLPTSLLIDREGREFGRAVGPAEWDGAATIAFLRHVVSYESQTNGRSDRIHIDLNR